MLSGTWLKDRLELELEQAGTGSYCNNKCVCNCLQEEVESTQISGNLDAPEGGFDAIMQAISCKVGEHYSLLSLVFVTSCAYRVLQPKLDVLDIIICDFVP